MSELQIAIERSKRGLPCVWESGGGMSNTGRARIVCSAAGTPKRAIYIRRAGHRACAEHALITIQPGDFVIDAWQHRGDFSINVYNISGIGEDTAAVVRVHEFSEGEWDSEPAPALHAAVAAARRKASCYHCKSPHFIAEETAV